MKKKIHSLALLLILIFLITISHTSSRKLSSNQEIKINKSVTETESFHNLMGMEECGNEDEECLNRRILADAHLDYIYTQNQKN